MMLKETKHFLLINSLISLRIALYLTDFEIYAFEKQRFQRKYENSDAIYVFFPSDVPTTTKVEELFFL